MKQIKAVLFDVDGTLVDVRCLLEPFYKACDELGVMKISEETFFSKLVGHRPKEKLKELLEDVSEEKINRLYQKFKEEYLMSAENCKLLPGAKQVLRELKNRGYLVGIVTTKARDTARAVLNSHDLEYDVLVSAEDVKKIKPDAEPVKKAAEKLGVKAEECVVVGDHVFDVCSANQAGAVSVGVLTGVSSKKKLSEAGAKFIIPDLTKLLEVLEG